MNETTAVIVAIASVVAGVGGLLVSLRTSRASARKDELAVLRGIIEELRQHDEAQGKEIAAQARQIGRLESEAATWKRRFERVCRRLGLNPDDEITGRLGPLPEQMEGSSG